MTTILAIFASWAVLTANPTGWADEVRDDWKPDCEIGLMFPLQAVFPVIHDLPNIKPPSNDSGLEDEDHNPWNPADRPESKRRGPRRLPDEEPPVPAPIRNPGPGANDNPWRPVLPN